MTSDDMLTAKEAEMTQGILYPSWQELVVYAEGRPQPTVLVQGDQYKVAIGGLKAGGRMPPHAEGPVLIHILEGTGQVIVGEETHAVEAGATVVVPNGAVRGIEAVTQLAFLAVMLPQ